MRQNARWPGWLPSTEAGEKVQTAYEIFCDQMIVCRAERNILNALSPRQLAEEFIYAGSESPIRRGNFLMEGHE